MADHTINPNDYSEALRILKTGDPAHADIFNPLFERLINNDAFMKALIERMIKEHTHSGADGDGAKIPFANIEVPAGQGGIVTDIDLAQHINERNPHGTRASDVGAASSQKLDEHLADYTQFKSNVQDLIMIKSDIVILSANWIDDRAISGFWIYDLANTDIDASTVVDVNIHLSSLENASDLKSATESFAGYVRLYADEKPTTNITADLKLIRESGVV
ncbi:hypothetical protein OXB_2964 [Bacillus sp. OxB-1]|uniref:hypothetical protein n=1 Tax=Bacillus sp. (strain OxB-1) TaxID=98228 RepID=UPI000581FA80|nr:hypothetical protein [Bacillus sp. OxB-1]BAQ11434.1 hypothetical protein OXB_2964 [Bacillus sp. OxB-1]